MTIPANRKRFPIVPISGLIISVFLILLIVDRVRHFNDEGYNNTLLIGTYSGLFFWVAAYTILSFLDYAKTTFDKTAVLTITDNGINDNLGIFSVGNISWTEIIDIKIVTALKTDFLVIGVKNPQSFIDRTKKFKQRPLKSFFKKIWFANCYFTKESRLQSNRLKRSIAKDKP